MSPAIFQPTRPLRGATHNKAETPTLSKNFNPRAPCGARRQGGQVADNGIGFQPTRPLRGATLPRLGGSDRTAQISTHAPLAGRDAIEKADDMIQYEFQPTRPLRGATPSSPATAAAIWTFQPTRPLRGATRTAAAAAAEAAHFNPRAPCGARRIFNNHIVTSLMISTHAPLAGRDVPSHRLHPLSIYDFNPRAPCGARRPYACLASRATRFQPTRPLRGATGYQAD